jgi:hypothetical protein
MAKTSPTAAEKSRIYWPAGAAGAGVGDAD